MIRARHMLSQEEELVSLDLTPVLDVIFMLLVFLLLTANSVQHALKLDLPEEGADQAQALNPEERITITLSDQDNRWHVNDEKFVSWQAVEEAVLERRKSTPDADIVIQGDRQTSMEVLLQALAFLKREGLAAAQILMERQASKER